MNSSRIEEPYTRSRTNLFLSYRDSSSRTTAINSNSYGYNDDNSAGGGESSRLMGGMEDTVIEMGSTSVAALPPKWVDLADSVDEILSKIKPKSELEEEIENNG